MSFVGETKFTVGSSLNAELKTPIGFLVLLKMGAPAKTEETVFSIFRKKEGKSLRVSRQTSYFENVTFLNIHTGDVYDATIVCKPGCVDEKTGEFKFSQQGETNYITLTNVPIRTASIDEYASAYERMLRLTGQLGEPGQGCCDDILSLVKKYGHMWYNHK